MRRSCKRWISAGQVKRSDSQFQLFARQSAYIHTDFPLPSTQSIDINVLVEQKVCLQQACLIAVRRCEHASHTAAECNVDPSRYRSEEHTSELQSLMRISYAVFCLKKKTPPTTN